METQKHLFNLPKDIHYLNGAYMSPNLRTVEEAGIKGVKRKTNPTSITEDDFFKPAEEVRSLFGKLINATAEQVALIPSASYGLMAAIQNVSFQPGQHAITVFDEFPSDHLSLRKHCEVNNAALKVIRPPALIEGRAQTWTQKILDAINDQTAVLVMSSIHWMEGLKFDLKAIGNKCKATNTIFIVDGTQSVGALHMDVKEFHISALICAAYKWLLGPYSTGLAYYSHAFDHGKPLENSWMTRKNGNDFSKLTDYPEEFGAGAMRYNVGEFSNFIALPMLKKALEQVLSWSPKNIEEYCFTLLSPLREFLHLNGIEREKDKWMSAHLYGLFIPKNVDLPKLMTDLKNHEVHVSARGQSMRISPHVYNDERDVSALIEILKRHL